MARKAEAKFIIRAIDRTKGTLQQVERNFKRTSRALNNMGRAASYGLTLPIIGAGVAMLKVAGDFEAGMNRVQAVSGATGKEFAALEDQAKHLGRTTQYSAKEASDAMGFLAMAGFHANEIIASMPSTLQLAAAAQIDLGQAADITSNILTGFGKDVSELAATNDILVATFTKSNTSLEQLGDAMKYIGPVAQAAGFEFEEIAAAVGLLGNAGIQATMAGTGLRKIILSLVAPTAAGADAMEKLGIQVRNARGQILPLANIFMQLRQAGASLEDLKAIVGDRAIAPLTALLKAGGEELRRFANEVQATGTAQLVAEAQMRGLNGAVKRLRSALEGFAISLAKSGIMSWFTNFINRAAEWVSQLSNVGDSTKKMAVKVGLLVAAIGPALLILGKLTGALTFMQTPLGRIVTVVGLLALAWRKWGDDVKRIVSNTFNWLNGIFTAAEGWMKATINAALDHIVGGFQAAGRGLATAGDTIIATMKVTASSVASAFSWMGNILTSVFGPVITWTKRAFNDLGGFVGDKVRSIADQVEKVLGIAALMPVHFGAPFKAALAGVKDLRNAIVGESKGLDAELGFGLAASLQRIANAVRDNTALDSASIADRLANIAREISSFVGNPTASLWAWARDQADAVAYYVANTTGQVRDMWLKVQAFIGSIGSAPIVMDMDIRPALSKLGQFGGILQRVMEDAKKSLNAIFGDGILLAGTRIAGAFRMVNDASDDAIRSLNYVERAAVDSAHAVGDGFVEATLRAEKGFESLLSVAQYVIEAILKAIVKLKVIEPLLVMLNLAAPAASAVSGQVSGAASGNLSKSASGPPSGDKSGDKSDNKSDETAGAWGALKSAIEGARVPPEGGYRRLEAIKSAIESAKVSPDGMYDRLDSLRASIDEIEVPSLKGVLGILGSVRDAVIGSTVSPDGTHDRLDSIYSAIRGIELPAAQPQNVLPPIQPASQDIRVSPDTKADAAPLTVNFNVSTVDARGFDDLLYRRKPMIVGMIQEAYQRRGRTGGPVK